ncbi:MAG: hypothetical protein ABI413_02210 [Ktedonobacteraceae bacterium]
MLTQRKTISASTEERLADLHILCVAGSGRGGDYHTPVCVAYPQPDGGDQWAETQHIRVHIERLLIAFDFPRVAALSGEEGAR